MRDCKMMYYNISFFPYRIKRGEKDDEGCVLKTKGMSPPAFIHVSPRWKTLKTKEWEESDMEGRKFDIHVGSCSSLLLTRVYFPWKWDAIQLTLCAVLFFDPFNLPPGMGTLLNIKKERLFWYQSLLLLRCILLLTDIGSIFLSTASV